MARQLSLKSSKKAKLNSSTDFTDWTPEKVTATVASLKSRAEVYNCKLVVTDISVRLKNRNGDMFTADIDDYWHVDTVEFSMGGSTIRGDLSELDEITEKSFAKIEALNELKQAWREINQWLDLLVYAAEHQLNSSRRRKLNSSLDYDYAGEELEDGYFEGSVAGICTGLSQKYQEAKNNTNFAFFNDIAGYVTTAADIISASQHNDNFEVEISASDEDEFDDTVAEVIEFLKLQQHS